MLNERNRGGGTQATEIYTSLLAGKLGETGVVGNTGQ